MTKDHTEAYQKAAHAITHMIAEHLESNGIDAEQADWSVYQPFADGTSLTVRCVEEDGERVIVNATGNATLFLPSQDLHFPIVDAADRAIAEDIIASDFEEGMGFAKEHGYDLHQDEFRIIRSYLHGLAVVITFTGQGESRSVKGVVKEHTYVLDEVEQSAILRSEN